MPIVDLKDLVAGADAGGFAIAGVAVRHLADAAAACSLATDLAAPAVLEIDEAGFAGVGVEAEMPAIEALAAASPAPIALAYVGAPDASAINRAIRCGFNGATLSTAVSGDAPGLADIVAAAKSCGLALRGSAASARAGEVLFAAGVDVVALPSLDAVAQSSDRAGAFALTLVPGAGEAALPDRASRGVAWISARDLGTASAIMREAGSAGQAEELLAVCRRWTPVEHVVAFNAPDLDADAVRALFERGVLELSAVPGVRAVRCGVTHDRGARYRYCWFITLASPAAVESYRRHPLHIAFADTHFRPVARDRLTTDYILGS